ncbi:PKD domain-containing protein, partial [Methanosarcina spelaei]|uniref:PKD domain-containing protein n=1 Tax=Methanosarcina spelaei TaxID=1036679 RepID=UPI001140FC53
ITYSGGKIYFGEAMGGHKYYCYDEAGNEVWSRTSTTQTSSEGSYYWAGAAVIGNSLVYGDDDGHLVSVNKDTGANIAEVDVSKEFGVTCGKIRSSVLYVEELKRIYFTSTGGYCFALGFNPANGTFKTSDKHSLKVTYSTSTPAYYEGRIYMGTGAAMGGAGKGLYCLDSDLSGVIWNYPTGVIIQSSPAISTYYDDGDGEVYIYFTENDNKKGGVYCLKDLPDSTSPELVWSYVESGKTAYSLQGVAISDGWVYFGSDNKYIFGFTTKDSQATKPAANFNGSPLSGNTPLTVQFKDKSTGVPTSWVWDFDNNGHIDSTKQNPTYKYSKAGIYTVKLTVTNAAGSNTVTKADYITVTAKPVSAFSASTTSGKAPLNVKFTDKSTGTPTKWKWNFGDGKTSTQQNPTHKYSKAGIYTVKLTVTNAAGSNTVTKSNYITVTAKPVSAFSASPTSGKVPLNVKFTDKSTGSPTKWKWNFGDGTTSTQQSPTHKYCKAGKYTVTLTVTNTVGSNTVTKADYIKVTTT